MGRNGLFAVMLVWFVCAYAFGKKDGTPDTEPAANEIAENTAASEQNCPDKIDNPDRGSGRSNSSRGSSSGGSSSSSSGRGFMDSSGSSRGGEFH